MHSKSSFSRDPTQLLIKLGANVNEQNPSNRYTALHYAIQGSNLEAIRILIDSGAKTSVRDAEDQDVYQYAAKLPGGRPLVLFLAKLTFSNKDLPRWLQAESSTRRLGTKLLPYIVLISMALIFQLTARWFSKGLLFAALGLIVYGFAM